MTQQHAMCVWRPNNGPGNGPGKGQGTETVPFQGKGRRSQDEVAAFALSFMTAAQNDNKGKGKGNGGGLSPSPIPPHAVHPDDSAPDEEINAAFSCLRGLAARWKHGVEVHRRGPRLTDGHRNTMAIPFSDQFPGYKFLDNLTVDGRFIFRPEVLAAAMLWDCRRGSSRWSIRRDNDMNVLVCYNLQM